jgi:hypothetical protein
VHYSMRCEWVKCGKPRCKTCPHGPYWYGYYREGGKVKKRYFGKGDVQFAAPEGRPGGQLRWKQIFNERTASSHLAREILGVTADLSLSQVATVYRKLAFQNHPDRGGDPLMSRMINAAFAYLRTVLR